MVEVEESVWRSAMFGELDTLKKLIEVSEEPFDQQDDRGFTPITWAARNGHIPVIEYLASKEASLEVGSFAGMKCLHHAANKNLEGTVKLLLKLGAAPNSTDDNNDSPLHWAAARGVLNIVVALIEKGADCNASNAQGATPLHKAAVFGQLPIVRTLIKNGADMNACDATGDSALHLAARGGFSTIVSFLLKEKAVSQPNGEGKSPADVAFDAKIKKLFEPK